MTTNFPNGITNSKIGTPLVNFGSIDPTKYHQCFDEFHKFNAADWIISTTETGAGSASESIVDGAGGLLAIVNDDADDDADFLQNLSSAFSLSTGKKAWFKTRLKLSDATQSDFVVGLQIEDTTPLDATDGVVFRKVDGSTALEFVVSKNGTSTLTDLSTALVNDTFVELGFEFDGSVFYVHVDGARIGKSVIDNLPDDELLRVSFGVQNGEAASKTLTLDYVFVATER